MRILILVLLLCVTSYLPGQVNDLHASHRGDVWINVGSPGFSAGMAWYQCLAFNPADSLAYVAFEDHAYGKRVSVMKYENGGWIYVGTPGFSAGESIYLSFAFSPSGVPHVAYVDFAMNYKASVMMFDGTAWVYVGNQGISAWETDFTSLAFNPVDSMPYVAYMDFAINKKATVRRFNGTAWENVGTSGFTPNQAAWNCLAFDPDGVLHLAYALYGLMAAGQCNVMKYTGENWAYVGTPNFSAATANYISLAFSPSGEPWVGYMDYSIPWRATVERFNGTNWEPVGLPGFTAGDAEYIDLEFSPGGEPHIGFEDVANGVRASVMKFNGTAWEYVGSPGFSPGEAYSTSLEFGPGGKPWMAFEDAAHDFKTSVMKLTHDNVWTGDHAAKEISARVNQHASVLTIMAGSSMDGQFTILDPGGRTMKGGQISPFRTTIDIGDIPDGIYLLKVILQEEIRTVKFIKTTNKY